MTVLPCVLSAFVNECKHNIRFTLLFLLNKTGATEERIIVTQEHISKTFRNEYQ